MVDYNCVIYLKFENQINLINKINENVKYIDSLGYIYLIFLN